MNGDPILLLRLLAALVLLQAALIVLARSLGRRLTAEVVAAGLLLPALLLLPWLSGPQLLFPTTILAGQVPGTSPRPPDPHTLLNDVSFVLMPWELEVRRAYGEGRLPLWSDLLDGGSSPWANPQASVLAPTSLCARILPAEHHLLAALALGMLVALQGAWLAARALGVRRKAALLAAAGYAAGGGILAWGLFPHSTAAAWAPWCFAASVGLARRSSPKVLAGCAVAYLCLLLAGQPEVAFGAGALAAVAAWCYGRRGRRWRGTLRVVCAGALGFALAAPVVVPFLLVVPESQRARNLSIRHEEMIQREVPLRRWIVPLNPEILVAPLSPLAYGKPYDRLRSDRNSIVPYSVYPGLLAVAGVALAIASRRARRRARPLLVVLAVGALLVGGFRPAVWLWVKAPIVGLQAPSRLLPIAALALALAAAVGLDRLLRSRRVPGHVGALVVAAAASLAVAQTAAIALLWVTILAAALLAPRRRNAAVALLALALLSDQIPWGRLLLPKGDPSLFYPTTPEVRKLVRLAGGPGGRAVGHRVAVQPAIFSTYGVSDPRPHNPLVSTRYLDTLSAAFGYAPGVESYFGVFERPEHPFLDFLGVRVVVSHPNLRKLAGFRVRRLSDRLSRVYLNKGALPRFFVTDEVDRVARASIPDWIAALRDPRRVALLAEEPGAGEAERAFRAGRARVVAAGPRSYSLRLSPQGRKLLASSIRGPEGWRARGDGDPLRTVTVNGAFLGVVVPDGVRDVELVYRPPGLLAGLAIAGLAGGVLVALLAAGRWRRRDRGRWRWR